MQGKISRRECLVRSAGVTAAAVVAGRSSAGSANGRIVDAPVEHPHRTPANRGASVTKDAMRCDGTFFYKPRNAWAADFIPYYADGKFQLFFLLDWRDKAGHGEGTPWYRISTRDFVHFEEHGEVLARGSKLAQDLYVFTGSVIRGPDGFHIFYTGHNPYLAKQGKPLQGVMHAVSKDMATWSKQPQHTFYAPTDRYEKDDWRDPFVFWNEEAGEYNMLLAARFKEGLERRRGLTALCASKDLQRWEVRDPFYAPDLYSAHECPDLFRIGDWWYFLFSEFSDKVRTRYRMSRSLRGPWITPSRDDFDGHAFYAAKTASDGKDRFLFGWNPTRHGEKDDGLWDWGGNLVVHQLHQQVNGELVVAPPASVSDAFQTSVASMLSKSAGRVQQSGGNLLLKAGDGFAAASFGPQPRLCKISVRARFDAGTREFGLMFRASSDLNNAYYIKLEPDNQRLAFDLWPRDNWFLTSMVELERPLDLSASKPVNFSVILDGNLGVAYVNDVAMNFRAYDLPEGDWGLYAIGGTVSFDQLAMSTL